MIRLQRQLRTWLKRVRAFVGADLPRGITHHPDRTRRLQVRAARLAMRHPVTASPRRGQPLNQEGFQ